MKSFKEFYKDSVKRNRGWRDAAKAGIVGTTLAVAGKMTSNLPMEKIGAVAMVGGKSIWKRMSKDPELQVTHHDSETGQQIKLQPHQHWDNNYDHEKPTHLRVKLK